MRGEGRGVRSEEGSGATVDKYMYIIYRSHDRCSIRAARPVARRPLLLTLISPDWPRGASRGCVSSPDSRTLLSGLSGWAPPSSDILFVQQLYKDLCRVSIVGCKGQQFDPKSTGPGGHVEASGRAADHVRHGGRGGGVGGG